MSVKKLFWADPYLQEIEATITGVEGCRITLDQTIAYAFSGGQQSDSGTIGGCSIRLAEKIGKEIFYTIDEGHGFAVGDTVRIAIDWEKRYRIMRLHFAAELILELVYQNLGQPKKIGANITSEKARLDFYFTGSIAETFPLLEKKLAQLLEQNAPIVSDFLDVESERRFWAIEGFAKVPCGGTHPRRTGEIGSVALKRHNIGGGKERIEITLKD